jgi:hypothetical protein
VIDAGRGDHSGNIGDVEYAPAAGGLISAARRSAASSVLFLA